MSEPDADLITPDEDPMKKLRWSSTHEFVVSAQTITPGEDEDLVERITELEAAHLWDKLDPEQRQAMVGLARDALERLARNVEIWLPEAIVPESNTGFMFTVLWKFAQLDNAVILMRAKVETEIQERLAALQEMADDGSE
jgi:hypothetical protein